MANPSWIKQFFSSQLMIALVLAAGLIFWPAFFAKAPAFGDNFSLLVPGKIFTASWIKSGQLPLWNANTFAGISWVGDSVQSIFYFSSWFFAFFEPGTALNLTLLVHFVLGFVGVYLASSRILRFTWSRLTAAVVWSMQPLMFGYLNNLAIYQTLNWMPWLVFLAGDFSSKRNRVLFLFMLFIQFAAGYPQLVMISLLACFWLRWQVFHHPEGLGWRSLPKEIGKWLGIGLIGIALTTVFWLPFVRELATSTRVLQTADQAQTGALKPTQLVKLIWPHFFSNGEIGYYWGPEWDDLVFGSVYLTGLGGLLLLTAFVKRNFSRQELSLLFGALISLLLALGTITPLYWLWIRLPILSFSRGPQHFLLLTSLMISFWLGLKLEQTFRWQKQWRIVAKTATLGAIGLSLAMIVWQIWPETIWRVVDTSLRGAISSNAFHTFARDYLIVSGILLDSWWLLVGLMAAAWLLAVGRPRWLVAVLALELFWAGSGLLWWAPASLYSQAAAQPLASQLKASLNLDQYRVLIANYNLPYTGFSAVFQNLRRHAVFSQDQSSRASSAASDVVELLANRAAGITPNWHLTSNFPSLTGFVTLLPLNMNRNFNSNSVTQPAINLLPAISPDNPWLRHWAVGYYLIDTSLINEQTVHQLDEQYSLAADYKSWRVYRLPQTLTRFRYENLQPAEIENLIETPNKIRFTLNNSKNLRRLLIADRYDSGWQARVNGERAKLVEFYDQRSIPIQSGTNEVVLTYRPLSLTLGFFISFLVSILILISPPRPRWLKGLFLLMIFGGITCVFPKQISALEQPLAQQINNRAVIINQVRGEECCDVGSIEMTLNQMRQIEALGLVATFAVRPDALVDENWQSLWSALAAGSEWGLLFEVTPDLARRAGVNYSASPETWHQAQHIFTLGYTSAERKKLADTAMDIFYRRFNRYPKLVTAWMHDSQTANYLRQQYGVTHLEITREQWATDSYTLIGGPTHYPYFADANWLFQPKQAQGLVILRQTLTDPLWNYGDRFSRFTGQPNDFTRDNKEFDYFARLLDQAFFQAQGQVGWAVLGLENSMAEEYQKIFNQELQLLADRVKNQQVKVELASQVRPAKQAVSVYQGQDLVSGSEEWVAWVESDRYRVRVRWNNQQLWLDDLRIYDQAVKDPYSQLAARSKGYWIVPFLLDGSRFYSVIDQEKFINWQGGRISKFDPSDDVFSRPQQLVLADIGEKEVSWQVKDDRAVLLFGEGKLIFGRDNWQWQNWPVAEVNYWLPNEWQLPIVFSKSDAGFELSWMVAGEPAWSAKTVCLAADCQTDFNLEELLFEQARQASPELLFPEQLINQLDFKQSNVYLHNPYLIVDQAPARIVFMPRSAKGLPVELGFPPEFFLNHQPIEAQFNRAMLKQAVQFYDLPIDQPGMHNINFVWQDLTFQAQVKVALNCRREFIQCLKHPRNFIWYFQALWASRVNQTESRARPWQTV